MYAFLVFDGADLHLSEHHGDACPGSAAMFTKPGLRAWLPKIQAKSYRFYNPTLEANPWGLCSTVLDPFHNRLTFCDHDDLAPVTDEAQP